MPVSLREDARHRAFARRRASRQGRKRFPVRRIVEDHARDGERATVGRHRHLQIEVRRTADLIEQDGGEAAMLRLRLLERSRARDVDDQGAQQIGDVDRRAIGWDVALERSGDVDRFDQRSPKNQDRMSRVRRDPHRAPRWDEPRMGRRRDFQRPGRGVDELVPIVMVRVDCGAARQLDAKASHDMAILDGVAETRH